MKTLNAKAILRLLVSSYPDKKVKPETLEIYLRCLADLPLEALQAAILRHITDNKWFPTIAELRHAAFELMPGGRFPTALEAWAEVTEQVADAGWYGKPTFSHPSIERAVNAFGWQAICESENVMADRAHFIRLYETFCDRQRADLVELPEVRAIRRRLAGGTDLDEKIRSLAEAKRVKEG